MLNAWAVFILPATRQVVDDLKKIEVERSYYGNNGSTGSVYVRSNF